MKRKGKKKQKRETKREERVVQEAATKMGLQESQRPINERTQLPADKARQMKASEKEDDDANGEGGD
ncbi:hypothetical protein M407DRAFT_244149 [Tulasnella calospora MUT 4182]|uniref:Uncharacterized protein n=1 Tax=Tulasnella calospora MUT 4182 TaxID=1051891 RepID=A0A0C3Q6X6_9AGAM|nr:hypothetical protein M407DRAFT_244149 [Tulasnella calospora MUT 4182]